MDDWESRLAALEARLREWHLRYEAELEAVRRERKLSGWLRKPRIEDLQAAAEEARRRAGEEILVQTSEFLDELCDLYPTFLPQDRAKIRARVGSAENLFDLFWGYAEQGPERVRRPEDGPQLLRGFIAIVIDDMRVDLELVDIVLGRLILAAAKAGIDWKPALASAARVANLGAGGGGTCMREHLVRFETSAHFTRVVEPALRADRGSRPTAANR